VTNGHLCIKGRSASSTCKRARAMTPRRASVASVARRVTEPAGSLGATGVVLAGGARRGSVRTSSRPSIGACRCCTTRSCDWSK
jgi:hypothetical protein